MRFENSERLTPDEARQFIQDLSRQMQEAAWRRNRSEHFDVDLEQSEDADSMQKQLYDETWTLIYGISRGIDLMRQGSTRSWSEGGHDGWEISDDDWQEAYEQYGYGTYGKGLEIGKKLAFYKDTEFEFTTQTSDDTPSAESEETKFELTDYSTDE